MPRLAPDLYEDDFYAWTEAQAAARRMLTADPRAGWERTILLARAALEDRLTKTVERDLEATLDRLYRQAATIARQSLEAPGEHEAAACIPAQCPFTLDEIRGR